MRHRPAVWLVDVPEKEVASNVNLVVFFSGFTFSPLFNFIPFFPIKHIHPTEPGFCLLKKPSPCLYAKCMLLLWVHVGVVFHIFDIQQTHIYLVFRSPGCNSSFFAFPLELGSTPAPSAQTAALQTDRLRPQSAMLQSPSPTVAGRGVHLQSTSEIPSPSQWWVCGGRSIRRSMWDSPQTGSDSQSPLWVRSSQLFP